MNHFERIAIFTMIEGIESQLRGLKTLLAAGGNAEAVHKTTAVPQHDPMAPSRLDPDQEAQLAAHLGMLRQQNIETMQTQAGEKFGEIWQEAAAETEPKKDEPN